jgi:hypothetical protein
MRRTLVIIFILVSAAAYNCGSGKGKNNASSAISSSAKSEIVFREYQHEFGKVSEGEKISYTFTFDNKGTSDLILSAVTTTCGCTVPKFEKKPIAPGASGNLEVVFDTSGKSGMQTKTITVKSNAKIPVVILKITAEVIESNK